MLKLRQFLAVFVGIALFSPVGSKAADVSREHFLIPVPSSVKWGTGVVVLDRKPGLQITYVGVDDSRVKGGVQRFLKRMEKRIITPALDPTEDIGAVKLVIETKHAGLSVQTYDEDESYALEVTTTGIHLSAENALGVLHGLETILQLVETRGKDSVLPTASIQDTPRFRWRGLLIDVCRHWEPLEVLERNIDAMAAAKLNILHWHLTEDQGFRIESKVFPKLHGMGSDGNFYTQEQVKGLIAYARERGIRVVPEFDMPGHTAAWHVGHPELGSAPGPYEIVRTWGVFDPTFDPSREEVFTFLDAFFAEMAPLFPDAYMHIGGDENNGKLWDANPKIQAFKRAKGYKSNEDLQAYFSDRVSKILTKYGKNMVGWDEILHLDLPKETVVHAWREQKFLLDSTKRGYDTILSNGYYLNHYEPTADHYLTDPVPVGVPMTDEQKKHVVGGEACMWGEMVDPKIIDSRIWPRCLAVAERLWSRAEVRDVPDFFRRMDKVSVDMEELGLIHRSNQMALMKDLAGSGDLQAWLTLADTLWPVQVYKRGALRAYTQSTPLNRMVDAVEPDSAGVRSFRADVDALLAAAPDWGKAEAVELRLKVWEQNDKVLAPLLKASERGAELLPLSKDLSELGRLGLEALAQMRSGKGAAQAWSIGTAKALAQAEKQKAELELAVLPAVRRLVIAAAQIEKLKAGKTGEWVKDLDALAKKAGPAAERD